MLVVLIRYPPPLGEKVGVSGQCPGRGATPRKSHHALQISAMHGLHAGAGDCHMLAMRRGGHGSKAGPWIGRHRIQ